MAEVVLKFTNDVQYQQFLQQVRDDVLKELAAPKANYENWYTVRNQIEKKLKADYKLYSSKWSTAQQGIYAVFKLAFDVTRVENLSTKDDELVNQFNQELFELIDKYRAKQSSEKTA